MNKATRLEDIMNVFQVFPLYEENYQEFYTHTEKARGSDVIRKMAIRFKFSNSKNIKVLFSGHTGSGKSTELLRLKEELKNEYHVIVTSVYKELDPRNIRCVDVLMTITNDIINYLENNNLVESGDDIIWTNLLNYWITTKVKESVIDDTSTSEVTAEIATNGKMEASVGGFGCKFKALVQIVAGTKGVMQTYSSTKETIRTNIEPTISQFIDILNKTISAVNVRLDKPLLIIVQDLDKLEPDSAYDVFVKGSVNLSALALCAVFTLPIHLVYSVNGKIVKELFDDCYMLEMIRVKNKDDSDNEEGLQTLKDIVLKRMDPSLIEPEALSFIISKSGGVIRDLFSMMSEAAVNAIIDENSTITIKNVLDAYQKLRSYYVRGVSQVEKIKRLYQIKNNPVSAQDDDVFLELLSGTAVIEYGNDEYCIIHPIIKDYLNDHIQELRWDE